MKISFYLFIMFYSLILPAETMNDDDEINSSVVLLTKEQQENSGIETIVLKKTRFQHETLYYGKAIAIQSLIELFNQYQLIHIKQRTIQTRLNSLNNTITRLQQLHNNQLISIKKLQDKQLHQQSARAQQQQLAVQKSNLINQSQLQWGQKITQWLITPSSPIDALIKGDVTLIEININPLRPSQFTEIAISATGQRLTASTATLIEPSPQINTFSQGLAYLFITDSATIKRGMNITAWLADNKQQTGIIIPDASLIWHLGEALVFIKDGEQFSHHPIQQPLKIAHGYFIGEQLNENDEIVVIGAQLLLSQELKSQIPTEDDDDDD